MVVGEIFTEQAVSMVKTVWRKRGDKLSRQDQKRLVATDVVPRSNFEVKKNEG